MADQRLRAIAAAALVTVLFWGAGAGSDLEGEAYRKIAAAQIPVEKLPAPIRTHVDDVLQNATLYVRGPTEAFPCRPGVYRWALDHPDWIIAGWNALTNTPITIEPQADGSFLGKDNQGGTLRWQCVLNEPGRRVWYAEGSGRLAPFFPTMSLKAVLALKFQEVVGEDGRVGVRHRTEAFAVFDAKAAGWFSRLVGLTPEAAGKKILEQVEIFFSGMAYYLTEHPEWAEKTLEPKAAKPEERKKLETLKSELPKAQLTNKPSVRPKP